MPPWLGSSLPIVSLVVTILLWWLNRRYTDKTAQNLRESAFALDEWKYTRNEVFRTLRAVEECFDRLHILGTSAHKRAELAKEVEKEGKSLTSAHAALLRELDRFEPALSAYGYGKHKDSESDWDRVHSALFDCQQAGDAALMRAKLSEIRLLGASLSDEVNIAVRARTNEHDPKRI